MNARTVYYYWRIYQHWLQENHLPDDSKSITVENLVDYVNNHIPEEDIEPLFKFCVETY